MIQIKESKILESNNKNQIPKSNILKFENFKPTTNKTLIQNTKIPEYVSKIRITENRHYAFLIYRNNIFSTGMNSYIQDKTCTTVHAELNALSKLTQSRKKYDIIVVKLNKKGDFGYAKPCEHCIQVLSNSDIQIKNVYYSSLISGECFIVKEKMSSLKSKDKKYSKAFRFKCGEI